MIAAILGAVRARGRLLQAVLLIDPHASDANWRLRGVERRGDGARAADGSARPRG